MREQRVTPLELFFDLVFVFAITRVTVLMADDLSWRTLAQGLLVLAALWWGWAAYAWLTNHVSGQDGRARVVVIVAMGAMVLVSLAVPEAFDAHALVFALGYLVMRLAHVALYWVASSEDPQVHAAVVRLLPTEIGPVLLVVAAFTDGWLQAAVWVVALVLDYGFTIVFPPVGFRVHAAHFAERFGLIVIIALGESIVAIGVGAGNEEFAAEIGAAAVLGVLTAAALWWAYFDVVAPVGERRLEEATGGERALVARDAFAYLHLPMIAGIQLFALGVEQVVAYVDESLKAPASVALFGGVALYLIASVAVRLRSGGGLSVHRLVAAAVLAACVPLGVEMDPLTALIVVTALSVALIGYELARVASERPVAPG